MNYVAYKYVWHAFSSLHKCMQQLLHTSLPAVLSGGGGGPVTEVSGSEVRILWKITFCIVSTNDIPGILQLMP